MRIIFLSSFFLSAIDKSNKSWVEFIRKESNSWLSTIVRGLSQPFHRFHSCSAVRYKSVVDIWFAAILALQYVRRCTIVIGCAAKLFWIFFNNPKPKFGYFFVIHKLNEFNWILVGFVTFFNGTAPINTIAVIVSCCLVLIQSHSASYRKQISFFKFTKSKLK